MMLYKHAMNNNVQQFFGNLTVILIIKFKSKCLILQYQCLILVLIIIVKIIALANLYTKLILANFYFR